MEDFPHLRRPHVTPRLTKRRRDLDAAAKTFREQQRLLVKSPALNVDIAVKALGKELGGNGGAPGKRQQGSGVPDENPLPRFAPNATRKPGQALKLHVTARDLKEGGTEPNFGWVDVPKPPTPEERAAQKADQLKRLRTRPQIRVRKFDVNPRTGQRAEGNGSPVEVKSLGPSLIQSTPGGDIGGRAASALGLIVDQLGKLRCPPGTPNANQFTDATGSNCFGPIAIVRGAIEIMSGAFRRLSQATDGLRTAQGTRFVDATPDEQRQLQRLARARGQVLGTPMDLEAADVRMHEAIDGLLDGLNVFGDLGDELTKDPTIDIDHIALQNAELIHGAMKKCEEMGIRFELLSDIWHKRYPWDEDKGTYWNLMEQRKMLLASLEEFIDDKFIPGSPEYAEKLEELEQRYHDSIGGWIESILHEIAEDQDAFQALSKGRLGVLDRGDEGFKGTGGFTYTDKSLDPTTGQRVSSDINIFQLVAQPYAATQELVEGDKITMVDAEPMVVLPEGGMISESIIMEEIAQFLRGQTEIQPYLEQFIEYYGQDMAEAMHGSVRARARQIGYHEVGAHVRQYSLVNAKIFDAYEKSGPEGSRSVFIPGIGTITDPPHEWNNALWAQASHAVLFNSTALRGSDIKFPPDVHAVEGSMLHVLAGKYYQDHMWDWWGSQQAGWDPTQYGASDADVHSQLLVLEALAELHSLRRMGIVGGKEIDDLLETQDIRLSPDPPDAPEVFTPDLDLDLPNPDPPDLDPGAPDVDPDLAEAGSWDRLNSLVSYMHQQGRGPRSMPLELRSRVNEEFGYPDHSPTWLEPDVLEERLGVFTDEFERLATKFDGADGLTKDEQARLFMAARGVEMILNANARRVQDSDTQKAANLAAGKPVEPMKIVPSNLPKYKMDELEAADEIYDIYEVADIRSTLDDLYPKLGSSDSVSSRDASPLFGYHASVSEASTATSASTHRASVETGLSTEQTEAIRALSQRDLARSAMEHVNTVSMDENITRAAAARRLGSDASMETGRVDVGQPTPWVDQDIEQRLVPALEAMDDNPLTDRVTVRMGMELDPDSITVGQEVTHTGFMQGSVVSEEGESMASMLPSTGAATVRIEVPAESRGMHVDDHDGSDRGLLLPPGKLVVEGIDDDGTIVMSLGEQKTAEQVLVDIESSVINLPGTADSDVRRERARVLATVQGSQDRLRLKARNDEIRPTDLAPPAIEEMTNQEMLDEFNDLRQRWGVEIAVPGAGESVMSVDDEMRMDRLREALDAAGVDLSIRAQEARSPGGVRSSKGVLGVSLTPEQIADHEILDDLEKNLERLELELGAEGRVDPDSLLGRLLARFGGDKELRQRRQRHIESIDAIQEALADGRFVESLEVYNALTDEQRLEFFHGKPLVVTADQTELAMRMILDNYRLSPGESDSKKLMNVKIVPTDSITGEEVASLLHKEFAEALENGVPVAEALDKGDDIEVARLIAELEASNTPFLLGKEHYDLCKVSVAGSNMFCYDQQGILRNSMPQFSGPIWDFDTREHQQLYDDALAKLANVAGHTDPSTDEYEDWFKSVEGWAARRAAHKEVADAGGTATKAAKLWHDQFDEKARQLREKGGLSEEEILQEAADATQFGADSTRELIDQLRASGVLVEGGFGKADLRPGDEMATGEESPIMRALLHLKASQTELIGPKVMKEAMKAVIKNPDGTYKKNPKHWLFKGHEGSSDPILVTADGFILDGHHRWAMLVAVASLTGDEDEILGHKNVVVVHLPVNEALAYGVAFADEMGMQRAPAGPDEAAPHPTELKHDVPTAWAEQKALTGAGKTATPSKEPGGAIRDAATPVSEVSYENLAGERGNIIHRWRQGERLPDDVESLEEIAKEMERRADGRGLTRGLRSSTGTRGQGGRQRESRIGKLEHELTGHNRRVVDKIRSIDDARLRGDDAEADRLTGEFDTVLSEEVPLRDELHTLVSQRPQALDGSGRPEVQAENARAANRKPGWDHAPGGDRWRHVDQGKYVDERPSATTRTRDARRATATPIPASKMSPQRRREREKELQEAVGQYQSRLQAKMRAIETTNDPDEHLDLQDEFNRLSAEERPLRQELRQLQKAGLRTSHRSSDKAIATRMEKKNKKLAERAKRRGITPFEQTDEHIANIRSRATYNAAGSANNIEGKLFEPGGVKPFGWRLASKEEHIADARTQLGRTVTSLREATEGSGGIPGTGFEGENEVPMTPEVIDFIRNSTDAEVATAVEKAIQEYAAGFDRRVRVAVEMDELSDILESGRYKTTHEARSEHSTPSTRRTVEMQWGYGPDTPAEERPASGFLNHQVHDQIRQAYIEDVPSRLPFQNRDHTLLADSDQIRPSGVATRPEIYGELEVVLRTDVSHRSAMLHGDSARGSRRPAKMNTTDPGELLASTLDGDPDAYGNNQEPGRVAELLHGSLTGEWEGVGPNAGPRFTANDTSVAVSARAHNTSYVEAVVHGAFDLDDIDHVRVPLHTLNKEANSISLSREDLGLDHPEVLASLRSQGLDDNDIERLAEELLKPAKINSDTPAGPHGLFWTSRLRQVKAAQAKQTELNDRGVDAVFPNEDAVDILDAKTYRSLPIEGLEAGAAIEMIQQLVRMQVTKRGAKIAQKLRPTQSRLAAPKEMSVV